MRCWFFWADSRNNPHLCVWLCITFQVILEDIFVCITFQVILGDIFGKDIEMERMDGLVDAESEKNLMKVFGTFAERQLFDSVENGAVHVFCK